MLEPPPGGIANLGKAADNSGLQYTVDQPGHGHEGIVLATGPGICGTVAGHLTQDAATNRPIGRFLVLNSIDMEDAGLSIEEAAARLGVHYMTIYRYVRIGRLPAERRGGRWRIREEDLALVTTAAIEATPRARPLGRAGRTAMSMAVATDRLKN